LSIVAALIGSLAIAGNVSAESVPTSTSTSTSASLSDRRARLNQLLNDQWEWHLADDPETASQYGDKRYNDKLTDYSASAIAHRHEQTQHYFDALEQIDPTGFSEQEALNRTLMLQQLRDQLADDALHLEEMPVNQLNGIHLDFPQLVGELSFTRTKDYDDYLARLKAFPAQVNQVVALMKKGMADQLMPPRYLLEKVADQADGIAHQQADSSVFAQPLAHFPAEVRDADRKRLHDQVLEAIRSQVLPAYQLFASFVRHDYAPHGRAEAGIWSLPQGDKLYEQAIWEGTTTHMTAEQIHNLGLRQIQSTEMQMDILAKLKHFNSRAEYEAHLAKERPLQTHSREEMLERYRGFIRAMQTHLPQLFGKLPKASVEVMPVESFREKEAPGAEYNEGSVDGSRPGRVMVNTAFFDKENHLELESTAYHEGVPGHHLQISLAQELPDLPPFRQHAQYNAFVEGWALYAESLAKQAGGYTDPISDYGRLESELFRAVRLVVDTGIHAKHWSRDQAIAFMTSHIAGPVDGLIVEVDRYSVWPGQALGYKIGQLKIKDLRNQAEETLKEHFDLRAFHDEVLDSGALPLDVLETRVDAWIKAQAAAAQKLPHPGDAPHPPESVEHH
jgi:uncharacterized protein (DUF885 family)